jgi:hypothetical protein
MTTGVMSKWDVLDCEYTDPETGDHKKVCDPHSGQLTFMEDTSRYCVVDAGRRLGKSYGIGHEFIPEAFRARKMASYLRSEGKRLEFWSVGPNYCLDTETEILTKTGWKRFDSCWVGDETLGIDELGRVGWTKITKVSKFDGPHEMLKVKMRGHDSLSTLNHRWLVEWDSYDGNNGREVRGTRWITSAEFGDKGNEWVVCARELVKYPEQTISDHVVELVAWYWTEGYYRGPGIEIAQSHEKNFLNCAQISKALDKLTNNQYSKHSNSFYIPGDHAPKITKYCVGKEKKLLSSFLTALTKEQLELFIEVAVDGDGHRRFRKGQETTFYTKYQHNADAMQMACSLLGKQSVIRKHNQDILAISIFERNTFRPASPKRYKKMERVRHYGQVWCPTTETGTWLARRNGTVYFTGNSDSEKPFRIFYNKCKALGMPFDKPGTYYSLESGDMTVSLWEGAFIYTAKSAAIPERLVGEGLAGCHIEEAAKMKEIVWTQMLMPTLGDQKGWAKFTSTPEGKNWFYTLAMKARGEENFGWSFHKLPSWYNPYVYPEPTIDADVKAMMRIMSENPSLTSFEIAKSENLTIDSQILQVANDQTIPTFQQEYCAEFTDFVGKVFKEFDEETHVRKLEWHNNWETVAAVDYGYRNPNVWLLIQIGPWGEINIYDELYQESLAADEFAYEILRRNLCPTETTEFYPDPASPGDTRTLENIFRRNGLHVTARGNTGGDLKNRLDLIRLALKNRLTDQVLSQPQWVSSGPRVPDIKRPQMMINSKCVKTIYELSEYRYPEIKSEAVETSTKRFELPMKKDDHTPEAIGRFLASRYHSASEQYGGGTRISKARFLNGIRGRGSHEGGYDSAPAGLPAARNARVYGTWNAP